MGFISDLNSKESTCKVGDPSSILGLGIYPGRKEWLPPLVSAQPCPAPHPIKACPSNPGTCYVELSSIKFLKQPV